MRIFTVNLRPETVRGLKKLVELGFHASRSEAVRAAVNHALHEELDKPLGEVLVDPRARVLECDDFRTMAFRRWFDGEND